MKIIYPEEWILNRLGRELEGLKGKGTYFINYALYDETLPRPHGAIFTHIPDDRKVFDFVASKVDYATCINNKIREYLINKGIKIVKLVRHGYDIRIKKEPVFGWNGRAYSDGRKGEDLIEKIGGVIHGGYDDAPEFYKKIDYLIIASRNEGGPVPAVDAIAAGVPVIGRVGVGWLDDLPIIRYKTDEELLEIVYKLRNPWSWEENWIKPHVNLFKQL